MAAPFPRIILASTSPRRIEMFRAIRLPFEARAPETDETARSGEAPRALVRRLAREKAESVAAGLRAAGAVVIAADTIVVAPNGRTILGKPRDRADALRMLGLLAGRTHTVHTGYHILRASPEDGFSVSSRHTKSPLRAERIGRVITSRVTMRPLSRADIERYVATGESMDKAGAYAAQGFGATLIHRLAGSYSNVVGLPLAQVLADLEAMLGMPPFSWPGARRG